VVGVSALVACSSGEGAGDASDHSAAYNLYSIDNDRPPEGEDDPSLLPYKRALNRVEAGCTNSPDDIADMALAVSDQVAADSGAEITTLRVLQVVAPGLGTTPQPCEDAFALVGTMLGGGG
jgi:hypothetical protein